MTAAERLDRELERIRTAGRAAVADWPPLTDHEIEQLAFILAPSLGKPTRRTTATPLPTAA